MTGAKIGHEVSQETRAKISAALAGRKGHPSPMKGKRANPEHVRRRAEALRKWGPVCIVDDCENASACRGMCSKHYSRWKNHGDTDFVTDRRGAGSPKWKGDDITYDAAHWRVRQVLVKTCRTCSAIGVRIEAALLHSTPIAHLKMDPRHGPYSPYVDDYVPLCVRCHRRYDSPKLSTRSEIEEMLIQ